MFLSFCGKKPRDEGAAFVAPSATVQGDVVLKPGSTVWYGAVLRGDDGTLTIGKNSNVQDNAVLHCDIGGCVTLGENVTVGHCALVHGCTVGDGSLIGMHGHIAEPLCCGQKLHHRGRGACAGGHGHPGQLGGGGRARPGHQAGERGTDRSQPAQRCPLCGARQTARGADEKRVRMCTQGETPPVIAARCQPPLRWGLWHRGTVPGSSVKLPGAPEAPSPRELAKPSGFD